MRVRFAPSPTGHLHVGNVRTALFNWLLARGADGAFILRIEDTDVQRSTAESESAILEDLQWLGLSWDEGPDVGGPYGPYRQSDRLALYRSRAQALLDAGRAYYCFCSPEQLEAERKAALAAGRPPQYSGVCRAADAAESRARVLAGEAAAIRFHTRHRGDVAFNDLVRGEIRFHTDVIGDQVILRSDGRPAYNFAVVVDDSLMAITHVVRAEDHLSNTPRQLLLYAALNLQPPVFAHLAMVMGPDHTPLSKRHGATSVAEFRNKGYLPEALVNYLALLGWSPRGGTAAGAVGSHAELMPIEELARRFSLADVGHSASVFDEEKLAWVNRHYLKEADPARLASLSLPYLRGVSYMRPDSARADAMAYLAGVMPLVSTAVDRLEQVPERLRLLFEYDARAALVRDDIRAEMAAPSAREVVDALAAELAAAPRLADRQAFRAAAERIRQRTGQNGKALFHPIRIALTAASDGPELDLLVPAIERGAELKPGSGLQLIKGCRERAQEFVEALRQAGSAGGAGQVG